MADHVEIERKYDAEPGFTLPDLSDLPGCVTVSEPETHELTASYFDTEDYRLLSEGITLRRRRGGDDTGWHLKFPAGQDAKREVHAPLGRSGQTPPARLANLVRGYTRGKALRPVARLETQRTVRRLLGEDDTVLAEVADDAVTGEVRSDNADETTVSAWREIEVELAAGSPDLLKAAGKRLKKDGAQRSGTSSKLGRLLADRVPTSAKVPEADVTAETAGDVAAAYLRAQVRAVRTYDPRVRLREYDSVHKMRVACRRMRSIFKSYRKVLDWERTAPVYDELTWLAERLGEVRDLEVLRERFTERLAGLPADLAEGRDWLDELAARERTAWNRLDATMRGARYYAILDGLDELAADPPLTGRAGKQSRKLVPDIVKREWQRLERAFTAIETLEDEEERENARHDARKAAKRIRYTAEAASLALGDPAKAIVANAREIQDVLGRYQDGVIAQQHLKEALQRKSRANGDAFTLGVLTGIERCDAQTALDELMPVWHEFSRPKYLRAL